MRWSIASSTMNENWVETNNYSRAGVFPRYSNGTSIRSIRANSPVGDGVVSDEASSLWATVVIVTKQIMETVDVNYAVKSTDGLQ